MIQDKVDFIIARAAPLIEEQRVVIQLDIVNMQDMFLSDTTWARTGASELFDLLLLRSVWTSFQNRAETPYPFAWRKHLVLAPQLGTFMQFIQQRNQGVLQEILDKLLVIYDIEPCTRQQVSRYLGFVDPNETLH